MDRSRKSSDLIEGLNIRKAKANSNQATLGAAAGFHERRPFCNWTFSAVPARLNRHIRNSSIENRNVELTDARWIGNHINCGNFPISKRETKHSQYVSVRRPDKSLSSCVHGGGGFCSSHIP